MLAAMNPKIVAELDALARAWAAVASEITTPTVKRRRARVRKPKASSKS